MFNKRAVGLGTLIALAAGHPTAARQTPTFRTAANVIAVEASVYDKNGQPVTDLTAADFQIFEDGQPQSVQTIYLVSSDPNFVKGAEPRPKNPEPPGSPELQSKSLEPVRRELRSRVLVFVFDQAHLSADGFKRSRSAVESFLKDGAVSADLVGIVSGGTMLNNKIDTDKAALLKAMDSMKGPNLARFNDMRAWPRIIDEAEATAIARGDTETTTRVVLRGCGERPEECQQLGGDEPVRQQVEAKARLIASEAQRDGELSLAMMQTLAGNLGRLPGSKNVIVFSEGFFTGELTERMKDVVTLAARNDVRFSTMDARGLSRDPRTQSFMNEQPLTGTDGLSVVTGDAGADVLSSLAIDTGGEVMMNRNDLRPAIDIVSRAAGTYYVLGYSPNKPMDGSYRPISVKVLKPGLTVRARKGYVAVPANGSATAERGSGAGELGSGRSAGGSGAVAGGSPTQLTSAIPPTPPTGGASTPPTGAVPSAPTSVVPSAPRFRPNSDRNVATLTRLTPGAGTSDVKTLADEGWQAYALGDVAVAREKLSAAVATGNAAPWVSYALGFADFALGQYEAAATAWIHVHTTVPEFMPVYFDLADAYISLGRGTDAIAILRDAARRWPTEPEPQNALATQLVKRGALDEAIDILKSITTAKPADSLGFFNLGRAYHLRYLRLQQNVASARLPSKSAIGEDDRQHALAAYKHYLTLGGPFEKEAKDAIAALDWK